MAYAYKVELSSGDVGEIVSDTLIKEHKLIGKVWETSAGRGTVAGVLRMVIRLAKRTH